MNTHIGKWIKIGISKEDYKKIYNRTRIKANTILKKRYKKQYSKILKDLMNKELNRLRR